MTYGQLLLDLEKSGYLKTERIIEAFRRTDRKDFVPEELAEEAYANTPLPIGWEQTISQPLTVAFMLEKLLAREGEKILDIGSGSGWQTAMLARIVGPKGSVYAVERIPELREFGERNVAKSGLQNVWFFTADGSKGLPEFAPYDRIIAAASADTFPDAWKSQVNIGGRIVAPIGNAIWVFTRLGNDEWEEEEYPGFVFVPLVRES